MLVLQVVLKSPKNMFPSLSWHQLEVRSNQSERLHCCYSFHSFISQAPDFSNAMFFANRFSDWRSHGRTMRVLNLLGECYTSSESPHRRGHSSRHAQRDLGQFRGFAVPAGI